MRDAPGVYLILLQGGDILFGDFDTLPLLASEGYYHAYTGESIGIRSRLLHHLTGTIRESTFRESLLALQFSRAVLWAEQIAGLGDLEARLSAWLVDNACVAYRVRNYIRDGEQEMLTRSASPLNLSGRPKDQFAKRLKADRVKFRQHLKTTGQGYSGVLRSPSSWFTSRSSDQRPSTRSTNPSFR